MERSEALWSTLERETDAGAVESRQWIMVAPRACGRRRSRTRMAIRELVPVEPTPFDEAVRLALEG